MKANPNQILATTAARESPVAAKLKIKNNIWRVNAMITTEDKIEIDLLYARACHTFDSNDGHGWASLYTPDGLIETPGGEKVGYEALRQHVGIRHEAKPGMRHLVFNIDVTENGQGCDGRAYFIVLRIEDGELSIRNFGLYSDELVKHDGVWKLKSRRITSILPNPLHDAVLASVTDNLVPAH
ncbi:nuclear transport factor 2 family protein [Paenarthrobacter sp. NPDC057981]|uniref:nuclear transport factor 2 family protein n=1 Tax=Paenarthrobacter sp. NPDC057981 TaxID=3346297 RepID=UPI0036DDF462